MSNGIKYIYGVATASQNSSVELCYLITWLDEEIQRLVRTILGCSLQTVMDFPCLKFNIRPKGRKNVEVLTRFPHQHSIVRLNSDVEG